MGVVLGALGVVVGSLEGQGEGLSEALALGLLRTPTLLVSVLPAVVAVGAGLGAARSAERGERLSLAAAGVAPAVSGQGALLVGLFCGLVGLAVHSGLVPLLEAVAAARSPHPTLHWLWIDGAAVHAELGMVFPVRGGRIGEPSALTISPEDLALARARLRPLTAPTQALFGGGARCGVELVGRGLRPVACALLAWLAWQRWAVTPRGQASAGVSLGLVWLVGDALARQWVLESGRPVLVSALATVAVAGLVVARLYRTWSQNPV